MPSINPNLIPSISPGNLFGRLSTDNAISIRWLTGQDPVYFDVLNRPLADLRIGQLILAKSLDSFSFNVGYLDNFPFLIIPTVRDGSNTALVPNEIFHDCHLSVPLKWYNLRLVRIDRLSGTNDAVSGYSGTVRFIFAANRGESGPLIALMAADYVIDSNLDYQIVRVGAVEASDVPGFTPVDPADATSIDGYIVFKTQSLDSSGIPTNPDFRDFLDLVSPGNIAGYEIADSGGITGGEQDFNAEIIEYGTGLLIPNAFNLITQPPDEGLSLDQTGTFFDAINLQVKNVASPTSALDAVNKTYVDNATGLINSIFLKRDGTNTFTGDTLNLTGARIINLTIPLSGGDAANKEYVDSVASASLRRDGSNSWLSSGLPLNMGSNRITNLIAPVAGGDATNKNYVDGAINATSDALLARDGSNTFTGSVGPLRMVDNRITQLADPVDPQDVTNKRYVDSVSVADKALFRDGSNTFSGEFGPLDMALNRITQLGDPDIATDATTKQYVDDGFLARDGSRSMVGNLLMAGNRIVNLAAPVDPQDAANKNWIEETLEEYIKNDGSVSWMAGTAAFDMGNTKIVSLGTPQDSLDAVNKQYVDDKFSGRNVSLDNYLLVVNGFSGSDSSRDYTSDSILYKWNGVNYNQVQSLNNSDPLSAATFTIGNQLYLIIPGYHDDQDYEDVTTNIYRWTGEQFTHLQSIILNGATQAVPFEINGLQHILLVSRRDNDTYTSARSVVYKWDGLQFTAIQSDLSGGLWATSFNIGVDLYLAICRAESGDAGALTHDTNIIIYKYDGTQFSASQSIALPGNHFPLHFNIDSEDYLAVSTNPDDGNEAIFTYKFNLTSGQFEQIQELSVPDSSEMSSYVVAGELFIVLAGANNIYKWDSVQSKLVFSQSLFDGHTGATSAYKIGGQIHVAIADSGGGGGVLIYGLEDSAFTLAQGFTAIKPNHLVPFTARRSDLDSTYLRSDGANRFIGDVSNLNLGNSKIIQLAIPTNELDAANKQYVDGQIQATKVVLGASIDTLDNRVDDVELLVNTVISGSARAWATWNTTGVDINNLQTFGVSDIRFIQGAFSVTLASTLTKPVIIPYGTNGNDNAADGIVQNITGNSFDLKIGIQSGTISFIVYG